MYIQQTGIWVAALLFASSLSFASPFSIFAAYSHGVSSLLLRFSRELLHFARESRVLPDLMGWLLFIIDVYFTDLPSIT
jgi:hypothetical protein